MPNAKLAFWDVWGRRHVGKIVGQISEYLKNRPIVVVDVGANSGLFIDSLEPHVQRIERAILFEPQKDLYAFAAEKYKSRAEITVENVALSDKRRRYDLEDSTFRHQMEHETDFEQLNFGLSQIVYRDTGSETCYSFDELSDRYGLSDIDIIKIDTESEDIRVLAGFTKTVSQLGRKPLIVLENNWYARYSYEETQSTVDQFCTACGYRNDIDLRQEDGDFYLFPSEAISS
jgi:FkbM family methyltransferase